MLPPAFNRYSGSSNAYGRHIDNATQAAPQAGTLVGTAICCTVCLSDPASNDGGDLLVSFFWIESMLRDDVQQCILLDMDVALNQLHQ